LEVYVPKILSRQRVNVPRVGGVAYGKTLFNNGVDTGSLR